MTTLTYAAPVLINGERVNVGAVVQFTSDGRPRAVNVETESGGVFKIKRTAQGQRSRTGKKAKCYNCSQERHLLKIEYHILRKMAIPIATNRTHSSTRYNHNKDAAYGVYNYTARFAFPVFDASNNLTNVRAYDCELVILNASDGKKYLYDMVQIAENTTFANDLLQKERQKAAYKAAPQSGVSNGTLTQSGTNSNIMAQKSAPVCALGHLPSRKDQTLRAVAAGGQDRQRAGRLCPPGSLSVLVCFVRLIRPRDGPSIWPPGPGPAPVRRPGTPPPH